MGPASCKRTIGGHVTSDLILGPPRPTTSQLVQVPAATAAHLQTYDETRRYSDHTRQSTLDTRHSALFVGVGVRVGVRVGVCQDKTQPKKTCRPLLPKKPNGLDWNVTEWVAADTALH